MSQSGDGLGQQYNTPDQVCVYCCICCVHSFVIKTFGMHQMLTLGFVEDIVCVGEHIFFT